MTARPEGIVKQWVSKAENDLRAATIVIQEEDPPTDVVCFHCHQVAEKYLKGYLIQNGEPLLKVHDLVFLANRCVGHDASFGEIKEAAMALNRYYIETRYPADAPRDYSKAEAQAAVDHANALRDFVQGKIHV